MKDGLRFVDCDMHIMEPADLFERYLDPAFRQRLESTLEELRAALAQQEYSESSTNEEPPLVQRLAESARHFEETHPNLSGMIGSIIDALGRMGI